MARKSRDTEGSPKETKVKKVKPRYVKPKPPPVVLGPEGEYTCKWCNRVFSKEKTLIAHLCEQRRRYEQRDTLHCRYGLQAYTEVMHGNHGEKITEEDFRKSQFYLACVKWGRFVLDVHCFNVQGYLSWLQTMKVPIDQWNLEEIYGCYLADLVFVEDEWDAVDRTICTMTAWAEEHNRSYSDYFRAAGGARVLYEVSKALVSGWVIYCSDSGREWLSTLTPSDLESVWAVVNPERWKIRLDRLSDERDKITELCSQAGL